MGTDTSQYEYDSVPIPTYDEAVSAGPSSSQEALEEAGDNTERQGLLQHGAGSSRRYQPPTVESARSSVDGLASSVGNSPRESMEELRRELQEMDIDDSGQSSRQTNRPQLRHRFSKQFSNLTRTLSNFHFHWPKWPQFNIFSRFTPHYNLLRLQLRQDDQACIIALRLLALLIVVSIIWLLFVSDVFSMGGRLTMGRPFAAASVENFVQGQINETNIADKLQKATNFAHLAGTKGSYFLAEWIQQEFIAELGNGELEEFQVYLNYPRPDGRRIAIVDPPELHWEAAIDEKKVYNDPTREQTLVFHGHSKSGNVTGPLIYANYGSREDFQWLEDNGVSLKGAIVLVRYYGTQGDRALKIKAAEMAGAAGCIIYSDPAEDGFVRGPVYPEGRYRPSDSVQRGGVSLMSWVVGDVLSPGFASTPEEKKRLKPGESQGLNQIPSLPIAWRDAQRLLQVLKGHGMKAPAHWVGGVPEVEEWWSGDQSSPKVNLVNEQDEVERQPIYNVLGRITGLEQPDKKIVVGNHRDSWCFGGADPGSGTAIFLEVVRVFGKLLDLGWKPLRTIEFASWDGEEYNLIGSTEHVENRLEDLRKDGVAYVNVDVGVSGPEFRAAASPLYGRILHQIMNRVVDPAENKTLKEIWEHKGTKLEGLGAGSDYVAFQDIAGTSSIDIGFVGEPYPYHSCYENFEWMTKFGDPGLRYHRVLAEVMALLILELSDSPLLPFDLENYASEVKKYVADLEKYAKSKKVPLKSAFASRSDGVSLQPLHNAAKIFQEKAAKFHSWDESWYSTVYGSGGFESNVMGARRTDRNTRLAAFESDLLDLSDGGGVPNRTQFKHVIFAPQAWSGYDEAYFPAIRDAIDSGNWTETQLWIDKAASIIKQASLNLLRR